MSNIGWIKLARKFTDWEWYDDANTARVMIHLLLTCNHKTKPWRGIKIKPGSKVTSLQKLAEALNLSIQKVRTALSKLESTGEVTCETNNKYSLISLNNWHLYQEKESSKKSSNKQITHKKQPNNTQPTIQQQPTNNPSTTNNNEKNDKKEENVRTKEYNLDGKKINFDEIIEFYHTVCHQMPKIKKLTTTRKDLIFDCLKDLGREKMGEIFNISADSDYMNGGGDDGWKANLEWIVTEKNYVNILEGKYGNRKTSSKKEGVTVSDLQESITKRRAINSRQQVKAS